MCMSCSSFGGRIYSHDVTIFPPPHHPYPCANFISISKLLNSLITKQHEEQFVINSSTCTKVLSFTSGRQCSLEFILLNSFITVSTISTIIFVFFLPVTFGAQKKQRKFLCLEVLSGFQQTLFWHLMKRI